MSRYTGLRDFRRKAGFDSDAEIPPAQGFVYRQRLGLEADGVASDLKIIGAWHTITQGSTLQNQGFRHVHFQARAHISWRDHSHLRRRKSYKRLKTAAKANCFGRFIAYCIKWIKLYNLFKFTLGGGNMDYKIHVAFGFHVNCYPTRTEATRTMSSALAGYQDYTSIINTLNGLTKAALMSRTWDFKTTIPLKDTARIRSRHY